MHVSNAAAPRHALGHRLAQTAPHVLLLLVTGVLVVGAPRDLIQTPAGETLAHVVAAILAAFALAGAYTAISHHRPEPFIVLVCGIGLTVVLELLQVTVPTRTFELGDIVDGIAGIAIAAIIIELMFRSASISEVRRVQAVTSGSIACVFGLAVILGADRVAQLLDTLGLQL